MKDLSWKKYIAEAVGTLSLSLAVLATSASESGFTPFAAALTLGLFVYTIGAISGCHINPAVTLGALSINKISWKDAIGYIVAQLVGAFIALVLASAFIENISDVLEKGAHTDVSIVGIGFAELVGAFFLAFGVASAVLKKIPDMMNGIVVGGSLLLGIFVASSLGAPGILNPAIAIMNGPLSIVYVVGPILGAIGGMWAYKVLAA
jgi:glycerol uptake facilitator-like aquaporin